MGLLLDDNGNNKPKTGYLRDGAHSIPFAHSSTHKETRKQDSKQKVFYLQPLRTSRNLALLDNVHISEQERLDLVIFSQRQ